MIAYVYENSDVNAGNIEVTEKYKQKKIRGHSTKTKGKFFDMFFKRTKALFEEDIDEEQIK